MRIGRRIAAKVIEYRRHDRLRGHAGACDGRHVNDGAGNVPGQLKIPGELNGSAVVNPDEASAMIDDNRRAACCHL